MMRFQYSEHYEADPARFQKGQPRRARPIPRPPNWVVDWGDNLTFCEATVAPCLGQPPSAHVQFHFRVADYFSHIGLEDPLDVLLQQGLTRLTACLTGDVTSV